MGYIPYSEIICYLNENRFVGYERDDYIQWITTIDRIYIKVNSEQQKAKEKKNKTKAPRAKK